MQHVFSGRTADDVWRSVASQFAQENSYDVHDGRGGRTYELLHVHLSIENPRERWVVSRQPPLNIAFALAEVIWILGGRRDVAFLRYWNSKLPNFVGSAPDLHGAYGYRLRHHFGVDQLERAFSALKSLPTSRQVLLQIWDPGADLPATDGSPVADDIPCNVMSILKVRNGRLEWMQIVRSNDLYLGLPHNLVQFTFLQEVIAGWLGLEPGVYSQVSDSLHLYERDTGTIHGTVAVKAPAITDRYGLAKPDSDRVLADMIVRIERLIADDLSLSELAAIVNDALVPEAYPNMLRILAAESARRRHWTDRAREMAASCTNPAITQMWDRWRSTRKSQGAG